MSHLSWQRGHALASARLTATARASNREDLWDVVLSGVVPDLPANAEVVVWPVTLPPSRACSVDEGSSDSIATFTGLSFEAMTAFFAFEVSLREGSVGAQRRFTSTVELAGMPDDRKERLLRSLLRDRRQVLRLLLLLLMDEGADVSMFVTAAGGDARGFRSLGGLAEPTLLEALLGSLSSNPERVEHVARLIADLSRTAEGKELLPEGLADVWEPVWAAWEASRR